MVSGITNAKSSLVFGDQTAVLILTELLVLDSESPKVEKHPLFAGLSPSNS